MSRCIVRHLVPVLLPTLLLAQERPAPVAVIATATTTVVVASPDAVDEDAVAFFLDEGLQRSQVMDHLSWMCDVYGPRVTGSPNLRKARDRAIADDLKQAAVVMATFVWQTAQRDAMLPRQPVRPRQPREVRGGGPGGGR